MASLSLSLFLLIDNHFKQFVYSPTFSFPLFSFLFPYFLCRFLFPWDNRSIFKPRLLLSHTRQLLLNLNSNPPRLSINNAFFHRPLFSRCHRNPCLGEPFPQHQARRHGLRTGYWLLSVLCQWLPRLLQGRRLHHRLLPRPGHCLLLKARRRPYSLRTRHRLLPVVRQRLSRLLQV